MSSYPLIVALCLLTIASCAQPPGAVEFRELRSMPNAADREFRFSQVSIEDQIDILLFSQLYAQDTVGILHMIAENGESKIPALLSRMDDVEPSDPRPRVALIRAIDLIDLRCQCLHKTQGSYETLVRNEMELEETDSEGIKEFKKLYTSYRVDIESRKIKY